MILFRLLLCVAVLSLAPFLFLQGLANARAAPGPVDWNGFWKADVAQNFLEAEENEGQLVLEISSAGRELAYEAFVEEPFATDALFLLAVAYRNEGRLENAVNLVEQGLGLDKRNRQLGILDLERAAIAGDFESVFAAIDRLTTTSPRLVEQFVRPLSAALDQEDTIPVIEDALDTNPRWAPAFWNSVPSSFAGVTNMLALRERTSIGTTSESDARLLGMLFQMGQFEPAFAFWDNSPYSTGIGFEAFIDSLEYPPLGWVAASSGDRSFSPGQAGEYEVFVEQGTFGELARQLVRLEPGTYSFAADVKPKVEAGFLDVTLNCATADADTAMRRSLDERAEWEVGDDCSFFWLVLEGSAWDRRSDLRASISGLAFLSVADSRGR